MLKGTVLNWYTSKIYAKTVGYKFRVVFWGDGKCFYLSLAAVYRYAVARGHDFVPSLHAGFYRGAVWIGWSSEIAAYTAHTSPQKLLLMAWLPARVPHLFVSLF
jgi:hypothetical protein